MFDLKQLRSFEAVANAGSFSAAAKELGYTQPAISQHIASLEKHFDTPLLHRMPRSVRLTDAGAAFLDHARAISARISEAEADIEAITKLEGGVVRLASIPSAGASLVPVASSAFRASYPLVEIRLSVACELDGSNVVAAGQADLVVQVENELDGGRTDPGVERISLLEDPFYLVLPSGHPRASDSEIDLSDFASESWIIDDSPCPDGAIVRRACEQAGFEPRIAFANDDYSAIQGYISAGGGIAMIPGIALQSLRGDLVARPVRGTPAIRQMVAFAPTEAQRSAACGALLEALIEAAASHGDQLSAVPEVRTQEARPVVATASAEGLPAS